MSAKCCRTGSIYVKTYNTYVQGFMEDLYSNPAVSSTVDFGQIKTGYWSSMNLHGPLNPKDRLPLNSEPFTPKVYQMCPHAW